MSDDNFIAIQDLELKELYTKLHNYTGYTVEIFKKDNRCKDGWLLMEKRDFVGYDWDTMQCELRYMKRRVYPEGKYKLDVHETYVWRENIMTGTKFPERYDTPYYCSPSSESFWSD